MKKIFNYSIYTFLLIIVTTVAAMAQPGGGGDPLPCDPDDTTTACTPLDTWVYVFGAAVLIITILHMIRKQKTPGMVRARAKNNRFF